MKQKKRKRRKKRTPWSIFFRPIKIVLSIFLIVLAICCVTGGAVFLKYQDVIAACKEKADTILAQTTKADFSQPSDTHIYDSSGNVIGTINSGHYEYVEIDDISINLQNAYIAQEDHRFYEHHGVDYIGLARAGVKLIQHRGEITQGGSTITQQVIKNTYLTQEKTFQRKITEIFAAPRMEEKYSKGEILEFYCNTNFYANRCYGVASASRYYFDKEVKDLTIWEAATLAGISNNPSRYDPVARPENSQEKRDRVIDNMEKYGFITPEESDHAKAQPLTVLKVYEPGTKESYATGYAIHSAVMELMTNEGFEFEYTFKDQEAYDTYREKYQEVYQTKSDLIRNGGFEIHTSLDSNTQIQLQAVIDNTLADFKELQENGKYALQGAAVIIDNRTGYVIAISGGRGTDDEYNRGYLSRRQPGSTIKPLIDYAPAFETGYYYPSRLVNDHLFEKGPKNSGGKYHGEISVREALNRSLNTVAWQVLQDIGVDKGISYLGKMHFAGISYMDNGNTSMSIGGFTEGARVVDMAKGYSVLANAGMYSNNTCIIGITSQYEGEVYDSNQPDERIFTADTAYMVTDVLKGTLDKPYGTGYGLGLTNMPAAGKTGTTNSNKDTWFCGYTKYFTTAVWVGYDTPRAMPGVYGKTYSGKIWHDIMEQLHTDLPAADWDMPETVTLAYVDSRGERTEVNTGKADLFSSIAEAEARSNSKKWAEEEKMKEAQAQAHQAALDAQNAANEAALQKVEQIQNIINELNGIEYRNSGTQGQIDTAAALLETLTGTEVYDVLKSQLDAAASRAQSLPEEIESTGKPAEIGPGINPVSPGTEAPGTSETQVIPGAPPGSGIPDVVPVEAPGL